MWTVGDHLGYEVAKFKEIVDACMQEKISCMGFDDNMHQIKFRFLSYAKSFYIMSNTLIASALWLSLIAFCQCDLLILCQCDCLHYVNVIACIMSMWLLALCQCDCLHYVNVFACIMSMWLLALCQCDLLALCQCDLLALCQIDCWHSVNVVFCWHYVNVIC